jgi:hypothetical protein
MASRPRNRWGMISTRVGAMNRTHMSYSMAYLESVSAPSSEFLSVFERESYDGPACWSG